MKAHVAAATHIGHVRPENQDCLFVDGWIAQHSGAALSATFDLDAQALTVAVLDGLGGHDGGALAARTAALQLAEHHLTPTDPEALHRVVRTVNSAVVRTGRNGAGPAELGTTVAGLVLAGGTGLAFNVGDSRVYQIVDGYLGQLSIDDRSDHGGRLGSSVLTQALGGAVERAVDPHPQPINLATAHHYLLCSDGIHDVLNAEQIAELVLAAEHPPSPGLVDATDAAIGVAAVAAVQNLIRAVLERGAPDNVTAILVRISP